MASGTALAGTGRTAHVRKFGGRVGKRVARMLVVIVAVVVLLNLLIGVVPGDPATSILGARATPESLAALRAELNLDQAPLDRIATSLTDAATGDLGHSIATPDRSVGQIVGETLPATAALIAGAVLIALVFGLPIGLWAGTSGRRWVREGVSITAILILAMPPFFLALWLILSVSLGLGIAPAGGWPDSWPENLRYLWLPSVALAGMLGPQIARVVQQRAMVVSQEEFVEAAHARGLSGWRIVSRTVLPNCVVPVITIVGFNIAALISGGVVVEVVFGLPGFGLELLNAVGARDYPVIVGIALVTAIIVTLLNALSDALVALVDPRVRT